MEEMVIIDGSHGEGGGQIIRTALALSALTGKPFEAVNIRRGRKVPGLKAQHLHCIRALESLCGAKAEGAEIGSSCLKFFPGKMKPQALTVDIGTAGSITLLLQSLLLPCILASKKTRLVVTGGTDVAWSMPVDYLNEVVFPHLRKYADIGFRIERRGYYPKGGGRIELKIFPLSASGNRGSAGQLELSEQGTLVHIKGVSHASKDLEPAGVADRQASAAKMLLKDLICPVDIQTQYCDSASAGSGIVLWAVFSKEQDTHHLNPLIIGADALGAKGKRAEDVGREAAEQLMHEIRSGAPADFHLCDNLIPFLAVFGGCIRTSAITDHTRANIYAVEQFFGKLFIIDEKSSTVSVSTRTVFPRAFLE